MTTTKVWTRSAIKAELLLRNKTLTGIARDAGLNETACRQGIIGSNRKGAEAIAEALGVPFREMFPDSYTRGRHDSVNTTSNTKSNASPKEPKAVDSDRNAA